MVLLLHIRRRISPLIAAAAATMVPLRRAHNRRRNTDLDGGEATSPMGTSHLSAATCIVQPLITNKEELVAKDKEEEESNDRIIKESERICKILASFATATTADHSAVTSLLDRCEISISDALRAAVLQRLSNSGTLALTFFRWAERQSDFQATSESYHYLIDALGKIKQFRLIWSLVDAMRAQKIIKKETFLLISRRYARARKVREAVEAFDKMSKYGFSPELPDYNACLGILCKSKHVHQAQEMFLDLKKRKIFQPDIKTYTILLEGWGHGHDSAKMKALFDEMINEGFKPDAVTYGILISSLCKMKKLEEAIRIFDEMKHNGCPPSPHIYCTLVNGLGSERRLDEALKFFNMSEACGFQPELPTYNALVGAYCFDFQFKAAYRVIEKMRKCGIGPMTRTYDIILHHLIKANQTNEAYRVFEEMGKQPGCEPELNTYAMMVSMFCSEEKVYMALRVWKQMIERGILPSMHMFSALINGLCYENRLDDACQYFQEMLDKGIRPPGQLYSKLKEALVEGGKNNLAFDLGQKLETLRKAPLFG